MKNPGPPLPLLVAVVGHRDLLDEDKERLREQVGKIFDELDRLYPSSKPFQLLSGLAEGADRLVAHIALTKHVQLVGCLPMKRALYEEDFCTGESRAEFDALVKRATEINTLPFVDDNTATNMAEQPRRDRQYEALGNYLVSKCQILIALWDGVEANLPGGTASVVASQRYGEFGKLGIDPRHPLDFPDTGPVYHVLTAREKNPAAIGDRDRWQLLHDTGFKTTEDAQKHHSQVLRRMDAFNKDAAHHGARRKGTYAKSANWLIPEKARENIPDELGGLIGRYALADSLALSYQRRTRLALRVLIFLFGLLGVFLFELFAHGPENYQGAFLFAYLVMVGIAYAIYRMANFREIKTRHLDYRALAEGLRLQIFWKLAGLPDPVAEHYLAKQRTELDWIRQAIRRWSEPTLLLSIPPNWLLVGQHWLQDQFTFFSNAAKRNRKWHLIELVCYWAMLTAMAAVGTGILVTQFQAFPALPKTFHGDWVLGFSQHGLLVIAMTMLPALAGAISAYALKMAFSEQRKQYDRMRDLYGRGLLAFEKAMQSRAADKDKLLGTVVRDLGREALSENADWVLLHRERLVEMFVSG